MIAPMAKLFIVARSADRDRLLGALGRAGLVHITPVDTAAAQPEAETAAALEQLARAIPLLAAAGEPAETIATDKLPAPDAAAAEALDIQRQSAELHSRLGSLHRQIAQLPLWGDLRLEQMWALRDAGVEPHFYSAPAAAVEQLAGECVHVLGSLPGRRSLVAVIRGTGELPEGVEPLPLPPRDRPSVRDEASALDAELKRLNGRLAELAGGLDAMRAERDRLRRRADYTVAVRSGLAGDDLYALVGWSPSDQADAVAAALERENIPAVVQPIEPAPDEEPPTLIRYPRWARPMKALFDMLGTYPGYREFDLSGFFMLALPLFAAMLIGDGGYGLVFLLLPMLFRRRMAAAAGEPAVRLVMAVGAVTVVWGVLTANFFGVTPADLEAWGGSWAGVGRVMKAPAVLWLADAEAARLLIIKVSFVIGCLHLVSAHLRQVIGFWPDLRALREVGFCAVLGGMFGVVWKLFGFTMPAEWLTWVAVGLIAAGFGLVVLFSHPGRKLAARIGFGFAGALLPMIAAFGDTVSYIRLMAVGLASYYIAVAFNGLGANVAHGAAWLWPIGALIIVFGHALNIALCVIAIFAHGVRLNMLEFSSNANVQWAGYVYRPFTHAEE